MGMLLFCRQKKAGLSDNVGRYRVGLAVNSLFSAIMCLITNNIILNFYSYYFFYTFSRQTCNMKEARFIFLNKKKWKEMEQGQQFDSERLAANFIELSDDLAYARTFYPGSDTERYLNRVIAGYLTHINQGSRQRKNSLLTFWQRDLPLLFASEYKTLWFAFVFFCFAALIGAFSAAHDVSFIRLILGDAYVDMTLRNIASGKPMGVYASGSEWDMFFAITTNNIRVAFIAFVFGLLFSVGSLWILFTNGIMLGAFQYFFFQHGLLLHSSMSVWAHGTFEITSIILAGAAGIVMGNGFLFPGTFTRLYAFRAGALKGIKIIVGLIPFFIIAGWIESFITRYADSHPLVGAVFIGVSLIGVVGYFVFYPYWVTLKYCSDGKN